LNAELIYDVFLSRRGGGDYKGKFLFDSGLEPNWYYTYERWIRKHFKRIEKMLGLVLMLKHGSKTGE